MPEDLSREELIALVKVMAATNTALQTTVEALTATNNELRVEIAAMRAQLGSNSKNSSKPPSSDGLGKPAPRSLRRKGGKPGGQDGRPGQTLRQVRTPDVIVRHEPVCCAGCGRPAARAVEVGVERRQVFDLPPTAVQVTEHQLVTRACRCGARTTGVAPAGVNTLVSYGRSRSRTHGSDQSSDVWGGLSAGTLLTVLSNDRPGDLAQPDARRLEAAGSRIGLVQLSSLAALLVRGRCCGPVSNILETA